VNSSRSGSDSRKKAVSIRINRSDVQHIKRLGERLGARDSDVIRFAIKFMLTRLAPLQDLAVRGRGLVPVFLDAGPELMHHFELDSSKLGTIINEGVEQPRRVENDDIQLIAMMGVQRSYVRLRVAGLRRMQEGVSDSRDAPNINGASHGAANNHAPAREDDALEHSLRQYLYEKYLFANSLRSSGDAVSSSAPSPNGGE
jgi:hypothetical protein